MKHGWVEQRGAVPDYALVPFCSEDYTEVVKGWRHNVGAAAAGYRGFGEPPISGC